MNSAMGKDPWVLTYTGKQFHFLNPKFEDIDIEDIAHSLSMQCRFNGHTREFYSVAEHSIRVSKILPKECQLAGLLHDAAEAYLSDVTRPFKSLLPKYQEFEAIVQGAIYACFGVQLGVDDSLAIKSADDIVGGTEIRDLMPAITWELPEPPLKEKIVPLAQWRAEEEFLVLFYQLQEENNGN